MSSFRQYIQSIHPKTVQFAIFLFRIISVGSVLLLVLFFRQKSTTNILPDEPLAVQTGMIDTLPVGYKKRYVSDKYGSVWQFPLEVLQLRQGYTSPVSSFSFLSGMVTSGQWLITNGTIYAPGGKPLGLWIVSGQVEHPMNIKDGDGNFFINPQGIVYQTTKGEWGISTRDSYSFFYDRHQGIAQAFQAGPMLLLEGRINPQLNPGSDSVFVRNGLCLTDDGYMVHAISHKPMTLYAFSLWIRDSYGCRDAVYLDGDISGYVDSEGRKKSNGPFATYLIREMMKYSKLKINIGN